MNKNLKEKIIEYYTKYYRDDCGLKNYRSRAERRLTEEENEKTRLKDLEKNGLNFNHKKICIVGAGTGGLAVVLKEKYNSDTYGIEPNLEAFQIIQEKCLIHNIPKHNFKKEIAENISFPNNHFDITYCHTVLEHVNDINKSIDEMIRITKPNGQIYINTPNYSYPYEGHYKIPFPTFIPKIFGHIYLLILNKPSKFLKTINFITEKELENTLKEKSNISWIRIKEKITKSKGYLGWIFNYLKFKKGIYPTQEIIITKKLPVLSILIVNYNSSSFIQNSISCLKEITKNPYQVFILDNNSKIKDWQSLKKITYQKSNVFIERKNTKLTGSEAHGNALNNLVQKINTPYFSIIDADAVWLKKKWDEILISKINEKIKIIGTQPDSPDKPQDFPSVYATFFETKTFKNIHPDFCPYDLKKSEDTGYRLREKYLSSGFYGQVLIMKNTRKFKSGPFHSLVGVGEYYLNEQSKIPFASHFGRGSSLGKAKYQKTWAKPFYQLPIIGNFLIKIKGLRERNQWFKICRQLIRQQIKNV